VNATRMTTFVDGRILMRAAPTMRYSDASAQYAGSAVPLVLKSM
jgi:hypothetical protein